MVDNLKFESRKARMIGGTYPKRPTHFAISVCERFVIYACDTALHQAVFCKFPVFIAASPKSMAAIVSTSLNLVDFQRDDFYSVIRLGHGEWPRLEAIKLFDETVIPMCSPELLQGLNVIKTLEYVRKQVLLYNHSMDYDRNAPTWEMWLKAKGTSGVYSSRGMHFSLLGHGLQAAIDGAGVVLGWRFLSAKDVGAGRVVELFDFAHPLKSTFYLVYPETQSRRPIIAILRDWLHQEIREN